MEDGKELDKTKTQKAIVGSGIKMVSLEKSETVMPATAYQITVGGGG